jgi:hypothetical protein
MVEILFCTNRPAEFSIPKLAEKESLFRSLVIKVIKSVFEIVIAVAIQSYFCLENQNNIFFIF